MMKTYLESIKELFANLDKCTPEKMMAFVEETKLYLAEMRDRLSSTDEYVRSKAVEQMQEIQYVILHQLRKICDRTGLTMEQLSKVVAASLSPADREMWSRTDREVAAVILPQAAEKQRKSKITKLIG